MMGPRPYTSPNREVVLDAALAVIDRGGLGGLTIRALARELGKPPMTLYTHFRSKAELLDLASERLIARLFSARHHTTWQAEFEAAGPRLREILREHPNWVALLPRGNLTHGILDVYERVFGLMLKDGLCSEGALLGFYSMLFLALGTALVERMMDGKLEGGSFDAVFDISLQSLIRGLDESAPRCKVSRRCETRALAAPCETTHRAKILRARVARSLKRTGLLSRAGRPSVTVACVDEVSPPKRRRARTADT